MSTDLSVADLATRVYILAAIFAQSVERKRAAAAAASRLEDLPALFNDLKIRLEDSFILTAQQKVSYNKDKSWHDVLTLAPPHERPTSSPSRRM